MEILECEGVIKKAWTERIVNQRDRDIGSKLFCYQKHLIQQSKKKFGNNHVELRNAKDRLRVIPQNYSSTKKQREREELRDQTKELWNREEIY